MVPIDPTQTKHIFFTRIKRRFLRNVLFARVVIALIVLLVLIIFAMLFLKPVRGFMERILRGPRMMTTFFSDPLYTLPNYNGRTNILFLGMGGLGHDGGMLTDTIIFSSLNLKTDSVTMISIPRDIWVPTLNAKINAAYEIGEKKATGSGILMSSDAVYEIVGEPIHYTVLMDFKGFEQLIDSLGGIDIVIDKSFTDEMYPIRGKENDLCGGDPEFKCRYETIVFNKGTNHMDGKTALKFSRSRHSTDLEEGTDFARAARQQKVIAAIKSKTLSPSVLLNPKRIVNTRDVISQYITVIPKLSDAQFSALAGFGYSFWRQNKEVQTLSLDMGDEENLGFLINPPLDKYNQWVLESRWGDWKEFQRYLVQKLEQ